MKRMDLISVGCDSRQGRTWTASHQLILVLLVCAAAHGEIYTGDIEYTAGAGANEATIAIDFDFDNSFLFSFRWDGTATGWDALAALNAGALDVFATDFGEWGMFVDDFDYPGGTEYDYGQGVYAGWAYFNSTDNETWSLDPAGVSFRDLSNGDWDSWVWTNYDDSWLPIRTPGAAPIPEPATMLLFVAGGLLIRKRKV